MNKRGKGLKEKESIAYSYYMQELVRSPEGKAVLRQQLETALPPRAAAMMLAAIVGRSLGKRGGKARGKSRCSKRLGTKLCRNWVKTGTDRCNLHQRK